jgi:hypothetical protein
MVMREQVQFTWALFSIWIVNIYELEYGMSESKIFMV